MGIPYSKEYQLRKTRINPRRGVAGAFKPKTRQAIVERDSGLCVKCKGPYSEIHHVIFRSQGGKGTIDNGVCVCTTCHGWAHAGREGREWFESYQKTFWRVKNDSI